LDVYCPHVEQLDELQLPQDPPLPDKDVSDPRSSFALDTNLDIALLERLLHFGHSTSSSDLDIERKSSNLLLHFGQLYSYIGIFLPRN